MDEEMGEEMDVDVRFYYPNYELLKNAHLSIEPPTTTGKTYLTQGEFTYYHYNCDDYDDIGWGCGYRTLQSVCSWISYALSSNEENAALLPTSLNMSSSLLNLPSSSSSLTDDPNPFDISHIPSIPEIQSTLVNIADKPESFLNSREWIGALEVFYVIDSLYNIPCKILHIPQCEDVKKYANIVKKYFEDFGGLIMMGGDIDASSKAIAGVHISGNDAYFLVIDPHFLGKVKSAEELIGMNYVRWQNTNQFFDSSFYNLCLPQIKASKY